MIRRKLATLLHSKRDVEGDEQPGAPPDVAEAERVEALRTRAETLSRELLTEETPRYPPDEAKMFQLESDYSERYRVQT